MPLLPWEPHEYEFGYAPDRDLAFWRRHVSQISNVRLREIANHLGLPTEVCPSLSHLSSSSFQGIRDALLERIGNDLHERAQQLGTRGRAVAQFRFFHQPRPEREDVGLVANGAFDREARKQNREREKKLRRSLRAELESLYVSECSLKEKRMEMTIVQLNLYVERQWSRVGPTDYLGVSYQAFLSLKAPALGVAERIGEALRAKNWEQALEEMDSFYKLLELAEWTLPGTD